MNSEPKEAIQLAVNSYLSKGFNMNLKQHKIIQELHNELILDRLNLAIEKQKFNYLLNSKSNLKIDYFKSKEIELIKYQKSIELKDKAIESQIKEFDRHNSLPIDWDKIHDTLYDASIETISLGNVLMICYHCIGQSLNKEAWSLNKNYYSPIGAYASKFSLSHQEDEVTYLFQDLNSQILFIRGMYCWAAQSHDELDNSFTRNILPFNEGVRLSKRLGLNKDHLLNSSNVDKWKNC